MKSEGLKFFTDIQWPLVGLIIFFATFALLIVLHAKLYRPETIQKLSQLPFEGDSHE